MLNSILLKFSLFSKEGKKLHNSCVKFRAKLGLDSSFSHLFLEKKYSDQFGEIRRSKKYAGNNSDDY